jgi:phosphoenolpyruvate carboxykinase (ATP)
MAGANGIFNFEGGCYAKTIRLSAEAEPEIYATTQRFGTVLENVVLDANARARFRRRLADGKHPLRLSAGLSSRTPAATGRAGTRRRSSCSTADAFGVMPPIAKLTPDQAMYHFLSGYTAKVAGTERGVTEPEATFSTCFGAPFMPRHPTVYGNAAEGAHRRARRRLLAGQHRLDRRRLWRRPRMPIKATRTLLSAALDGSLKDALFRPTTISASRCPLRCRAWTRRSSTRVRPGRQRPPMTSRPRKLVDMFIDNFASFEEHVDHAVLGAAPRVLEAAE